MSHLICLGSVVSAFKIKSSPIYSSAFDSFAILSSKISTRVFRIDLFRKFSFEACLKIRSKIGLDSIEHSRNRIIEHMVQVEFHNFPHLEFQNDRLWAQIYTQDQSYFLELEPYCCARLRTNRFRMTSMLVTDVGDKMCYKLVADVGDRCWWPIKMLVTDLIHWKNHQYKQKSPT